MNEGARHYAWAQLHATWRSRLALVVLLGAVGTIAIAAAAGALRTNSAVDRFLAEQRAFDVAVLCGPAERSGGELVCEQQVAAVDGIADTAPLVTLPGLLSVAGRNLEPFDDTCWSGQGDVSLVVAPDGRFGTAINTHRFIDGRPADPSRPDEIVISRELARRAAIEVGDTVDVQLFAGADCLADPAEWMPPQELVVVGIEISPFEVRPESGEYRSFVHGTPALLAEVGGLPDLELAVAARFQPGVGLDDLAVPFEQIGVSLTPIDEVGQRIALAQSLNADNLRRSARPYVVALWLVAGLAAMAGVVLLGQSLSRQIRRGAAEHRALGQLGSTRRDLTLVGAVHVASVVVPAAALAMVGSFLASGAAPLGIARVVEPDPGWRLAPGITVFGGVVMVASFALAAVPAILVTGRPRSLATTPQPGRAGALARRVGGGPVTTNGLRMAFEPLRGPTAPPLRSGFAMVLAAVVMLVGAVVFGGSLAHLLQSKHLVGWNWDALMFVEADDTDRATGPRLRDALSETAGVAAATEGMFFPPMRLLLGADGLEPTVVAFSEGPVGPTLVSGRAPRGASEIALGRETLSRLGLGEGDRVPFVAVTGDFDEVIRGGGDETAGELTIVGTAVIPATGGENRLGTGGAVDVEFYRALLPEVQPDGVFVRLDPGADLRAIGASAADTLGVARVESVTEEVLGPQLLDLEQVKRLPLGVAALLALLAVGVVAQVIVGSTHARRGELGVLRALGFRPRQITAVVVVQALALSTAVLVIGLPLGIAVGRIAWRAFALSLGTKPEVTVMVPWLLTIAAALLLIAALLALVGSARHRAHLATALRTE